MSEFGINLIHGTAIAVGSSGHIVGRVYFRSTEAPSNQYFYFTSA